MPQSGSKFLTIWSTGPQLISASVGSMPLPAVTRNQRSVLEAIDEPTHLRIGAPTSTGFENAPTEDAAGKRPRLYSPSAADDIGAAGRVPAGSMGRAIAPG